MKEKKIKKNKSKIRNKGKTVGGISIIGAVIMAFALFVVTTTTANDVTKIVRTKADISCGKQITEQDIEVVEVGKHNLSTNVIENKADVIGKYATIEMKSGDYVFSSKVSSSALGTDTQLANISDGQVAISFSVKSLAAGLSNKLQAGDIIRIYSYDEKNGVMDYKELYYVRVISVSDTAGKEVNEKENVTTAYATITVSATTEQAKQIIPLESSGNIYVTFITRNSENAQILLQKQAEMLS